MVSYSIRVYKGRDPGSGRQLTPYTRTWRVPEGWGEKRARKEAERQAFLFERQCRQGFAAGGRQTFAEYAEYVMACKTAMGMKHLTELHYRQSLGRVLPMLGTMKLCDIKPQHLNLLYQALSLPDARSDNRMEQVKPVFWRALEERGVAGDLPAKGGGLVSLARLREGKPVKPATARRIADALGMSMGELFTPVYGQRTLSAGTVMNCHMLVSTVLGQAEKEMLIPYNPARRAALPKRGCGPDPNYFQEDQVGDILRALEGEPIKWRAAVNLLLASGCRRGELLGLKWDRVDWEKRIVRIDCAMHYAPDRGLFEGPPKTRGSIRTLVIPGETMELLWEHKLWQQEEMAFQGTKWKESPYVFTGEHGGPMNPSQLGNWLTRFEKRHGLPHLNPHAFRHTMTSLLLFSGVDSISVSHRLGHSSVATTTNIYGHLMKQAEEQISDRMEEIISRAKSAALDNGGESGKG